MNNALAYRLRHGLRTARYPAEPPTLPERFRGRPELLAEAGADALARAAESCPTGAYRAAPSPELDLGACLFCGACARAGAVRFSRDHQLAAARRDDLRLGPGAAARADALNREAQRLFGRSLKLRQVSAGGCNACEADVNVLNTLVFDLGRFGIQFVASPRHADGLLVTGPVSENMREALLKTYAAVPPPKVVMAVGACAISGGPYRDHPEAHNGVAGLLPVDLFVPGCPPHPYTILDGLLRFLGRL